MVPAQEERARPLISRRKGSAMNIPATLLAVLICLSGCAVHREAEQRASVPRRERHLANVTQLTFDGDNGEAYFSADGKKLIFQSSRGGYGCDKIWTMNIDGSEKRMVSPDHGAHTCSFFLPDGRIVYSSTSHLSGDCPPKPQAPPGARYVWPLYPYDIYIADRDGSHARRLTDNPKYDAEPVVSSDGKRIVFGSQREGNFDVYIMNVDGSGLRRLTDRMGYNGGPWFSPDGSKIVWRAWYPETPAEKQQWKDCMEKNYILAFPLDLWVMDSDGSNKRLLLRNGATNFAPSWHPDGKRIIFASNMDDWRGDIKQYGHNFELYFINLDGTGLERITFNTVFDSFPMFSPDGRKLAWASNRNPQKPHETDIFIADWVE
jgi:TolB protein